MNLKFILDAVPYTLSGRMQVSGGHLPVAGHTVPKDFVGVGVTTADNPLVDDYVLERLAELGISQVRVDFTYGDMAGPVARLLDRLLATDIQVLLHLVQPFEEVKRINTPAGQAAWREFVSATATRYGERLWAIEVGSTINRRRWSGYDTESFFTSWNIAYDEIKSRNIRLAGPNISDFEPLWNIAVLTRLKQEGKLPDIHTNNLFSERVVEPERFDHRLMGSWIGQLVKVNLVKKCRILKKITSDFGIDELVSPSAFWTLPRIKRVLVNSEQKMADYLTRYMVLCAASGSMRQIYWGPMLCNREGLIDDDTGTYPLLERVTHYHRVLGDEASYRIRPAFRAMQTFIAEISGSRYEGALATTGGLQIHAFRNDHHLIHVAWAENGKALPLRACYREADIAASELLDRDGECLTGKVQLISEAPLYLTWSVTADVQLIEPDFTQIEHIYRHIPDQKYYLYDDDQWHGMLVANSSAEAELRFNVLHPDHLPGPTKANLLRRARNAVWTVDGALATAVVAKKPLKIHPHKRFLERHRPSKARRSWIAAAELLRRGIPTAMPLAYFEKVGDRSLLENYFICDRVDADFTAREILSAFRDGASHFQDIPAEQAYRELGRFLFEMHCRGVYFRDLSGGNILIKKLPTGELQFTLIDINRARFFNRGATMMERLSDLSRVCNKLHWDGREQLIGQYLQRPESGGAIPWHYRIPFYLYDFKAAFKRRYGRKAIKRLLNRAARSNGSSK